MERPGIVKRVIRRSFTGGVVGLLLGLSVIGTTAAAAPSASELAGIGPAPITSQSQEYQVGFYATGGKIYDLHAIFGESFEQVVKRNTGARWEFGYDQSFRFIPADGGPALMGTWDVTKNGNIEFEAGVAIDTEEGRYEAGMRGRIDVDNSTAKVEQASRFIRGGEALGSYTEFTIGLY